MTGQEDFKNLQKNYQRVIRELEVDKVVNSLFEREVFDIDDKEDVESAANRTQKAERLLTKIMRRGKENFSKFCDILGEFPSQKHLERLLRNHTDQECVKIGVGIQEQQLSENGQQQKSNSFIPKSNLRCNPPRFIGREKICNTILEIIAKGSIWLVMLIAPPGFGKSSVATAVRHMLLENGYQVLDFSLRNVTSVATLATMILDRLNMSQSLCDDPLKRLKRCLQMVISSKTVFVLDNAEDLQEGESENEFTDLVKEILENIPETNILITTRKKVRGLCRCNFQHKTLTLEPLSLQASAELLTNLAPETLNMEQAHTLGKCCGGVPLVLNIAGSNLEEGTTPDVLIKELQKMSEKFLMSGSNPDTKDYFDCLRIFMKRLLSELRRALTRVAVFPAPFTEDEAIILFPDQDACELHMWLKGLMSHALLQFDRETKKYNLHPIIQKFCKVTRDDGNLDTRYNVAEELFIKHYLNLVRQLHLQFIGKKSKHAMKQYQENKINIQHALLASVKCNRIDLQQFGIDVSTESIDFLAKVLRMHEFQTIYNTMIDVARHLGDDERYSDCLTSKGFREICFYGRNGQIAKVRGTLLEAHKIQNELGGGDREPRAHCLIKLGVCDVYAGDPELGISRINEGIAMRKRLLERFGGPLQQMALAAGYSSLAVVFAYIGKHESAVKIWLEETLEVYHSILGYHPFTATLLEYIATSITQNNDMQHGNEAITFMKDSLEMRSDLLGEEHFDTARAHFGLGRVLGTHGRYQEALHHIDRSLDLLRRMQASKEEIDNIEKERNEMEKKAKAFEENTSVMNLDRINRCENENVSVRIKML